MNKSLTDTILTIGVIGSIAMRPLGIHNAVIDNLFFAFMVIGLLAGGLLKWGEQRAKSKGKGKRSALYTSTAYFIFIMVVCLWGMLEKLGIL